MALRMQAANMEEHIERSGLDLNSEMGQRYVKIIKMLRQTADPLQVIQEHYEDLLDRKVSVSKSRHLNETPYIEIKTKTAPFDIPGILRMHARVEPDETVAYSVAARQVQAETGGAQAGAGPVPEIREPVRDEVFDLQGTLLASLNEPAHKRRTLALIKRMLRKQTGLPQLQEEQPIITGGITGGAASDGRTRERPNQRYATAKSNTTTPVTQDFAQAVSATAADVQATANADTTTTRTPGVGNAATQEIFNADIIQGVADLPLAVNPNIQRIFNTDIINAIAKMPREQKFTKFTLPE